VPSFASNLVQRRFEAAGDEFFVEAWGADKPIMNDEFHRRWAGFAQSSALPKRSRSYNLGLVFWGATALQLCQCKSGPFPTFHSPHMGNLKDAEIPENKKSNRQTGGKYPMRSKDSFCVI